MKKALGLIAGIFEGILRGIIILLVFCVLYLGLIRGCSIMLEAHELDDEHVHTFQGPALQEGYSNESDKWRTDVWYDGSWIDRLDTSVDSPVPIVPIIPVDPEELNWESYESYELELYDNPLLYEDLLY